MMKEGAYRLPSWAVLALLQAVSALATQYLFAELSERPSFREDHFQAIE